MTIKELAEELGVTKQAVWQRIKRNPELRSAFEEHSKMINGTLHIDRAAVKAVKAVYANTSKNVFSESHKASVHKKRTSKRKVKAKKYNKLVDEYNALIDEMRKKSSAIAEEEIEQDIIQSIGEKELKQIDFYFYRKDLFKKKVNLQIKTMPNSDDTISLLIRHYGHWFDNNKELARQAIMNAFEEITRSREDYNADKEKLIFSPVSPHQNFRYYQTNALNLALRKSMYGNYPTNSFYDDFENEETALENFIIKHHIMFNGGVCQTDIKRDLFDKGIEYDVFDYMIEKIKVKQYKDNTVYTPLTANNYTSGKF